MTVQDPTAVAAPSPTEVFRAARDLLVECQTDDERARTEFEWPRFEHFNFGFDWFDRLAQDPARADVPALIIAEDDGRSTERTFAELSAASNRVANWLSAQGLRRGDRLILMLNNQVELWEFMLACIKLRVVMVPTTTQMTSGDLEDRVTRAGAAWAVAGAEDLAKFAGVGEGLHLVHVPGVFAEGPARRAPEVAGHTVLSYDDADDAATELTPAEPTPADDAATNREVPERRRSPRPDHARTLDTDALYAQLMGRWRAEREDTRKLIKDPALWKQPELTYHDQRQRVFEQLGILVQNQSVHRAYPAYVGGGENPGGNIAGFEELVAADPSLQIKAGVQWGLFGGAIENLGTQRHHDAYVKPLIDLDLLGCFAMTESGHGSDVQALGTTATYDVATQEFVVHTPTPHARKDYIGNAARDARMAAVFAQLGPLDVLGAGLLRLIEPFSWWINTIAHGVADLPVVTIPANPLFTLLAYAWIIAGLLYHRPWLTLALTLAGIAWLGVAAG